LRLSLLGQSRRISDNLGASRRISAHLGQSWRISAHLEQALVFFRDVTTFRTLLAVLVGQTATMAPLLPRVVAELVGPLELLEFGGHFVLLGLYTLLHSAAEAGGSRGGRNSDFFVVSAQARGHLEPCVCCREPGLRLSCPYWGV